MKCCSSKNHYVRQLFVLCFIAIGAQLVLNSSKPWITTVSAAQDKLPATTAFDEISVVKRPVQKGTIVGMSPTTVTVDVNGEKVSFPVNEIVRINYDREPVELKVW